MNYLFAVLLSLPLLIIAFLSDVYYSLRGLFQKRMATIVFLILAVLSGYFSYAYYKAWQGVFQGIEKNAPVDKPI